MTKQVHQVVGALREGDAIGNEILAFRDVLQSLGYESSIFCGDVSPSLRSFARKAALLDTLDETAICLYHYATWSPVSACVLKTRGPVLLRYHNVTPAHYFVPFDPSLAAQSEKGRTELRAFRSRAAIALPVSDFNATDLRENGFDRVRVLPLCLRWDLYAPVESAAVRIVRDRCADGRTNILFVGRVAPNKKIDTLIRAFAVLQRYVNPRTRLIVAGEFRRQDAYFHRLQGLVDHLRLEEVIFTGAVSQDELNALYGVAHTFLCLSEHEGYGAPLVEAMHFGVPVVALDAGATRQTLQGGGVLLTSVDYPELAELVDRVASEGPFRSAVLKTQAMALSRIRSVDFRAALRSAIEGEPTQ